MSPRFAKGGLGGFLPLRPESLTGALHISNRGGFWLEYPS